MAHLSTQPSGTARPVMRRFDIDWLRVLAILAVFIFHSSRFFDEGGWHVKNSTTYFGVQVWITFLGMWMMPFIFVVSGASTFYALSGRNWDKSTSGGKAFGRYLRDRLLRLVVPLVVGIFTHSILQVYLERTTRGEFSGSFWQFLPHYFEGFYGFGGNFAWMGLHLWYLEVLFVFSLLTLPLFAWLKGRGAHLLQRADDFLARPGALYLLAVPIMLLTIFLTPGTVLGNRDFGGWSLVPYLLFYVYGFVLVSGSQAESRVRRQWPLSLGAGVLLVIGFFIVWGLQGNPVIGSPRWALVQGLLGLCSWCWILGLWGLGTQRLTQSTPFLRYANEAVLPFYVMHQTVLLIVGYFVVRWPIGDLAKWALIAPVSFAIILAMYEYLVRRVNFLRFLFGMKGLDRSNAARPVPSVAGRFRTR